jgi:mycothiol synthase
VIDIRPGTEQDYPAIVEIVNRINSDRMVFTAERFRAALRSQPPDASAQVYVAETGGQIAGYLWLNRLIYAPRPDAWHTELLVHPDAQGRGTGSRLYAFLLDRLAERQAGWVRTTVREDQPAARSFAAHRGFQETGHGDRPSRLDVRTASTEPGQRAAERLAREGIRLATLAELGDDDEELLQQIYALDSETHADVPGWEDLAPTPFAEWRRLRAEEGEQPDRVWLALAGETVVGLATLLQQHTDSAYAGYTAVARTHRGRGIARALKHAQVEWARRHGISSLFTENDVQNAPMLRVNTELGYRPVPADLEVIKERVMK